jgi:hypothetical protein
VNLATPQREESRGQFTVPSRATQMKGVHDTTHAERERECVCVRTMT